MRYPGSATLVTGQPFLSKSEWRRSERRQGVRTGLTHKKSRFFVPQDPDAFGPLDPDPLIRGMDPDPALDPSIIKQK
jgi:hypothetical protein